MSLEVPSGGLDHFSAHNSLLWQWVDDIGGVENLGNKLLRRRKDEKLPVFVPPKVSIFQSLLNKQ